VKSERPGRALLRSLNFLGSLIEESFQASKDLLRPPLSARFSLSFNYYFKKY